MLPHPAVFWSKKGTDTRLCTALALKKLSLSQFLNAKKSKILFYLLFLLQLLFVRRSFYLIFRRVSLTTSLTNSGLLIKQAPIPSWRERNSRNLQSNEVTCILFLENIAILNKIFDFYKTHINLSKYGGKIDFGNCKRKLCQTNFLVGTKTPPLKNCGEQIWFNIINWSKRNESTSLSAIN